MEFFKKAKAVSIKSVSEKLNGYSVFKAETFNLDGAKISVAAADFYRLTVNGKFVGFGPARTAAGYARVDEYDLTKYAVNGKNTVVIEAVSYKCRTLSAVIQPNFLTAEIVKNGEVLACTGKDFIGYEPEFKMLDVEKYSYQRHFSESYDTQSGGIFDDKFKREVAVAGVDVKYIERVAPYPDYIEKSFAVLTDYGTYANGGDKRFTFAPYGIKEWHIVDPSLVKYNPRKVVASAAYNTVQNNVKLPVSLPQNGYAAVNFGKIYAGFIGFTVRPEKDTVLYLGFSEGTMEGEHFAYTAATVREGTTYFSVNNAMTFVLKGGETFDFYSFEPYVFGSMVLLSTDCKVTLSEVKFRKFEHYPPKITRDYKDDKLNLIYESAVRSFLHNAVDLYTDCPSRERAGWLCDSYFSAYAERFLFNESKVEKAFLQNYVLYENKGEFEQGVIPMCYPSTPEANFNFIPQWTMWFILEAHEYIFKRGGLSEKANFYDKVKGLLAFYERYENADGLLEDLPKWNFVEWTAANDWTKNVNYPTNFLYSETLRRAADILGDESLKIKAEKVAETAIKQSFDGKTFFDHSLRDENGKLILQKDCSEICQYYAACFAGIDLKNDKKYAYLYNLIKHEFTANRKTYPEIVKIDMFIGVYMRLLCLLKLNEYDLILTDVKEYFGEMGVSTRTLWEHINGHASRDHGFASFAAYALDVAYNGLNAK